MTLHRQHARITPKVRQTRALARGAGGLTQNSTELKPRLQLDSADIPSCGPTQTHWRHSFMNMTG